MFCINCNSRLQADPETKLCEECAGMSEVDLLPPENNVVCDVWRAGSHAEHVARFIGTKAQAFAMANREMASDNLVSLYDVKNLKGRPAFDNRVSQ